jgi:hypothetical protein
VIYVPFPKELSGEFTLCVRAADPEALRADLLTLVNRIDPRITWTSIRRGDMRFQDEAREMAGAVYAVGAAGTVALARWPRSTHEWPPRRLCGSLRFLRRGTGFPTFSR